MIKGVSRQVVDIPQPESAYFERAIFFVKPECASLSEGKLRKKADEMVKSADEPPRTAAKRIDGKIVNILLALFSAAAGAGVTLLVGLVVK